MLFLQALLGLIIYDALRSIGSFNTIHSTIKSWRVGNKLDEQESIERVCRAVNYACAWYPKQVLCLQRAFVTTYLLRKQGVSAEMVLGAQKLPFKAHAWVEVNGQAVNERSNVQATYGVWERC